MRSWLAASEGLLRRTTGGASMRAFIEDKWRELLILFSIGAAWLLATLTLH
jgi:hypothetical protein